jgi:hypothetical protein
MIEPGPHETLDEHGYEQKAGYIRVSPCPFSEFFREKPGKKIDFWINGDYICYLLALGPVRGLSLCIDFGESFGACFRIGDLSRMD